MILVPDAEEMADAFEALGLNPEAIMMRGRPTALARLLADYFAYRANVLMNFVEPRLMNAQQAKALFKQYRKQLCPNCPIPMNKQTGDKKAEAFLTALVNMIVESRVGDLPVDYDPRELTTFTGNGVPLRTLARRVDGAFPETVNPVAIWEIKEYYYTTTFGSRVADGVYETLLDGMELESLRDDEDVHVDHVLVVDAHYTWWVCGKPYLCRIID